MSSLSDLRELLYHGHHGATPHRWQEVCDYLDECDGGDLDIAIDYVNRHTDDWMAKLRPARSSWWQPILQGGDEPRLAVARFARFPNVLGESAIVRVLAHASARHLRAVSLRQCSVSQMMIEKLADLTHLDALEELDLSATGVGHVAMARLATAHLPSLRHVELHFNGLDDLAIAPLLESKLGAQLDSLQVRHNTIGGQTLELVSELELELDWLDLSFNPVGQCGVHALGQWENLKNVRRLDLWRADVGSDGVATLASSDLRSLEHLDIGNNMIDDAGIEAMFSRVTLSSLVWLNLAANEIGPRGVSAVVSNPTLAQLQYLNLHLNHVGNDGVAAIAERHPAWELRALGLGHNSIGDAAIAQLVRSPVVRHLEELGLDHNELSPRSARAIRNSPYLPEATKRSCLRSLGL